MADSKGTVRVTDLITQMVNSLEVIISMQLQSERYLHVTLQKLKKKNRTIGGNNSEYRDIKESTREVLQGLQSARSKNFIRRNGKACRNQVKNII